MTDANAAKAAWAAFDAVARDEAEAEAGIRIIDQFAVDPDRLARMSVDAAGLHLDLSKQSWSRAGFETCLALALAAGVEAARARLFGGAAINSTEGRAVLHPALRAAPAAAFEALGEPVSAEVDAVRQAIAD